jgi:hypothetical protein
MSNSQSPEAADEDRALWSAYAEGREDEREERTEQDTREALEPCPFCGEGETKIVENGKMWSGMKWSDPASVSVRHWCTAIAGRPSRMIERVGKDEPSAIAAWNRRAALQAREAPPTLGRDGDWILAMGHALGLDSGYRVPIVPTVEAFKELFASIQAAREAPPDLLTDAQIIALADNHSLHAEPGEWWDFNTPTLIEFVRVALAETQRSPQSEETK